MHSTHRKKSPDPRKLRENLGLTQEKLAELASVGVNTVRRCEGEKRWPNKRTVRRRYMAALQVAYEPMPGDR